MSPLCETFLDAKQLAEAEAFFPLDPHVCHKCFLVQLEEYVAPEEIFDDRYRYYSSYSESWIEHARRYVDSIIERLSLDSSSLVVEVASNDGYLLQHLVARGIRVLGVDPAANVAAAAAERGVRTLVRFFGTDTVPSIVSEYGHADLIVANNVLAHTPHLNDFVAALELLLASSGVTTVEFPHLLRLIDGNQFDTIYHEHFSYFSFATITEILRAHGLDVYDVEELWTHGGSLRVYTQQAAGPHETTNAVPELLAREEREGLRSTERYARFAEDVKESKRALLELLIRLRREGKQVVGYGAPGKGNTLLNYCGIRTDLLDYTVDRNPYKHGLYTPGTHIPIFSPEKIAETRPDYILVLPWNLIDEISAQLSYVAEWGGQLIVPVPFATVRSPKEAS
jgi:SAM-dependent methyltransferase